jgi:uncharacterized membrane protein
MKRLLSRFKTYVLRGVLAVIPIVLSVLAIQYIYIAMDKRVLNVVEHFSGIRIPGLGIVLAIVVLFFVGLITSHVIGRRIFNLIEKLTSKIPLVKTIYRAGQQISDTLSLPEKQVFKRAVLVDIFKPDAWSIGFITGTTVDKRHHGKTLLKIFVPTVPNPTTGFLVMIDESRVVDPGWTVEEAVKVVISGGILGPEEIKNITK